MWEKRASSMGNEEWWGIIYEIEFEGVYLEFRAEKWKIDDGGENESRAVLIWEVGKYSRHLLDSSRIWI